MFAALNLIGNNSQQSAGASLILGSPIRPNNRALVIFCFVRFRENQPHDLALS